MGARLDKKEQDLRVNIARRILELRESSGKKQSHFASENLNIEKQTMQRLESGRGASIYSIHKICQGLGIKLRDFFDSPLFDD